MTEPAGNRAFTRRPLALSVALLIFGGAVAATLWVRHRQHSQSSLDAARYQEMVSAFYTGVIAMQVDNNDLARAKLTSATQIDPREPAAWADLGLLQLRSGNIDDASASLNKAHELAPANSSIEMLLGLLQSRRGDFAGAVAHFHHAAELDPQNLRAHYAIAAAAERDGGPDADVLMLQQYQQILQVQPDNLAVLLDSLRQTAKLGDTKQASDLAARLAKLSASWPADAQKQLATFQQLLASGDLRQAATQVVFLRNLLVRQPEFRSSIAAVMTPLELIGEPIEKLLTLPSPRPTPAPADPQISFETVPLGAKDSAGWIVPAWLSKDGPATVLLVNDRAITRIGAPNDSIPIAGAMPHRDSVLAVDWPNDFRSGLVVAGKQGVRLLKQSDDGHFSDVTGSAVAGSSISSAACFGTWAADIDLDGDLDIILGLHDGPPAVLRNNSDGTFKVIHPFAGIQKLRDFAWVDLSGDGAPQACLLDSEGKLSIYANDRGGKFHLLPAPRIHDPILSLNQADVTGDGRMALLALTSSGDVVRIVRDGSGWAITNLIHCDLSSAEAQLLIADVDHNGAVDMIVSTAGGTRIFLADENRGFTTNPIQWPQQIIASSTGTDGHLEFLGFSSDRTPIRMTPHGSKAYGWQTILPRSKSTHGDGRVNSFGIGGQIELRAGLLFEKMPITSGAVNFGLGNNPQADAVRVLWPNGTNQAEFELKSNQLVVAEQRLKGSCPMLFAWDGKHMSFVTDLIWRSPLGLRINAQTTAAAMQTRDWVKIRADQLTPHDGYYDLRVTAELWETHYFDHISLMAVDHPADTEVFIDERFAVPQPPLKIYLTGKPFPLTRATDEHGNDVTDIVAARDGRYLDSFARGRYQGIATDHWVQLELGREIPADKPLVLLGFGWVHPTDSSINLAIDQGNHPLPRALALEVPDGNGGWRLARDNLGIPAGKNKTIVLNLQGLWKPQEPRRLRLRTNLEVYWDWLAVAQLVEDDSAAAGAVRTAGIAAHQAQLAYHGFSKIEAADEHSPELPQYENVIGLLPRWRDLAGFYTRFGDVRELLENVDDRYVIMNAGDELRLRFAAPPAPPRGWTRDFVLIADGWEKDGDYNTGFSQTVMPLPRHAWPAYDQLPASLQDDPVFQRFGQDWVRFHTRYVASDAFDRVLRSGN